MSGLFTSFGVGVMGLRASHNSLNTTSHNIVNSDTDGFVRQQIIQQDMTYNNYGYYSAGTNQIGLGTEIAAIRQIREQFLDSSYRKEFGRQGFYEAQYNAISEIESLFGELEGVRFQESLEKFWTSIEELSKEPESIVTRASVIQTATSFLERAGNIYSQLKDFQSNLNTQVLNTVKRINDIGYEIHSLNTKIRAIETGPENANDYRDQRNALLDELGKLCKISYHEYADGIVTVNVEGVQFVRDFGIQEMAVREADNDAKVYIPVWGEDGEDVFNFDKPCTADANTDIGFLKGLLLSRGDRIGTYFDIPIAPDPSDYNEGENDPAYEADMVKFNLAVDDYNDTTSQSVIIHTQAQFDQLIHGVTTILNDILCPNITATWSDNTDIVWRDRTGRILEGDEIPSFTQADLEPYAKVSTDLNGNETGMYTVSIFDFKNAPVGMDTESTLGEGLFARKSVPRYEKVIDEKDNKLWIYNREEQSDWYTVFSIGEVEVNPAVRDNLSKLPLSKQGNTGDYTMDVANKLCDAFEDPFATLGPDTLTQNNFMSYYTAFVSAFANTGQTLKAISENQATTATGIDSQRQDVMGVSSDEELTYLIKFQNAYNASSRYITVIDEMLEHVVTVLGNH